MKARFQIAKCSLSECKNSKKKQFQQLLGIKTAEIEINNPNFSNF